MRSREIDVERMLSASKDILRAGGRIAAGASRLIERPEELKPRVASSGGVAQPVEEMWIQDTVPYFPLQLPLL